jgi:O-antigen ligase
MRKIFYIDDSITNKISYWHLVCFLVTLPFDFFYSEIVLISFGVHTLIHVKKEYFKTILSKEVLVPISIYVLGAVALLYSPDKTEGINILTRQLAILIFPLAFALNGLNLDKYKLALFQWFAFTCVGTILYLYIDAFVTIGYFHLPVSTLFTLAFMNHNFSFPIEMHATYLSMYVAFSIIVFSCLLAAGKTNSLRVVYIACIILLSAGMLQLSSRAAFIALVLVIVIVFPFLLFKGRRRIWFIIISVVLSALLLFAIDNIDSFKTRYLSELKKDLTQKPTLIEVSEPRIARWEVIMEMVKRSPVVGYGTGAEKDMLQQKYFEKKLYTSFIHQFNTHSEYLSFLLKTGIIGFSLFIYTLYFGFARAWRTRDAYFFGFMILITIVCVSENVLDLNKGIFFYGFFFSLFV